MMRKIQRWLRGLCMPAAVELPNAFGAGTHEGGKLTRKCDSVFAVAHLLVMTGSDADHVAVTTAATDKPLGFAYSPTDAIEDDVGVQLCGKGADTKIGVAKGIIANDAQVCGAAGGKIQTLPTDPGTYWVLGRAIGAAAAEDDPIEIDDCHPYPATVV